MPSLNRVWELHPQPDAAGVPVWIERLGLGSQPLGGLLRPEDTRRDADGTPGGSFGVPLRKSSYVKTAHGFERIDAGDPVSFGKIRARIRQDLSTESIFLDEGDRVWMVEKFNDQDGRNQFLTIDLAAYSATPHDPVTGFIAPVGWTLQRNGAAVQVLEITTHVLSNDAYADYVGFRAKSRGWTAANFDVDEEFSCIDGEGATCTLTLVGSPDASEGLAEGESWPGQGALLLNGSLFQSQKLHLGSTLRIASA